jgi:SAM-dependent methyltransferase
MTTETKPVSSQILNRRDYAMIAELVEPGSRVLDLGCGEGELLAWLREYKRVDARGVEIESSKLRKAIGRGLRFCDSEPDAAGDAEAAADIERDAAGQPARHRCVSQLWALDDAAIALDERPRATHATVPARLVRLAQLAFPHG